MKFRRIRTLLGRYFHNKIL